MNPPTNDLNPQDQTPNPSPAKKDDHHQRAPRSRRKRGRNSLLAHGEPMVWCTGGALVVCLAMILGLLALVFTAGTATFWPKPLVRIQTADGRIFMGEIARKSTYESEVAGAADSGNEDDNNIDADVDAGNAENPKAPNTRRLIRTGNFRISNTHFDWVRDTDIKTEDKPNDVMLLERVEWGRFYGFPVQFVIDDKIVADSPDSVFQEYNEFHDEARNRVKEIHHLESIVIGGFNRRIEQARLALRKVELRNGGKDNDAYRAALKDFDAVSDEVDEEFKSTQAIIRELKQQNDRYELNFKTAQGDESSIKLADIVRAYFPNRLSIPEKIRIYLSRWKEFLTDEPREANSEGGVFPAIFGTVLMSLIMTIAVVPCGVLAALYIREYARKGPMIGAIRIAINNLAGVPSIVFGVFGLGFFCYVVGGSIDQLFFEARLPSPTFGKGGILWAALTLSLLTLPVVIIATEEALAAVPGSMRQGAYACGASKWQTIWRIVLPRALPGIMTGAILAMARGAGEVAPLMLVGAVKLAPELPFDRFFPYIHPERSFMHLGFHIFDLGFQSQNSEAAKPMVFTTTLILILIIAALNLSAVMLRTRLRKKFVDQQF